MKNDRKIEPLMEILPIVFLRYRSFPKIRMKKDNELTDRFFTRKINGSFQVSKRVTPFYKKLI